MAEQKVKRVVPRWLVVIGIIFIVGFTGVLLARVFYPQWFVNIGGGGGRRDPGTANREQAPDTELVISLTAVTSVESSGPVEPLQITAVLWETSGQVQGIHVNIGDQVTADQTLLSLNPRSVSRDLIQAQVDLINARNMLRELLDPPALDIANAQNTVAQARKTLQDAEYDLNSALNPAGQILFDEISDAELALFQAESNAQLVNVNADVRALEQANADVHRTQGALQRAQQIYDDGLHTNEVLDQIKSAQGAYNAAIERRNELNLRILQAQTTTEDVVVKARDSLEDAVQDLNFALLGPDAQKVERTRATMLVAAAEFAEAEEMLNELLFGADPDDIAAAQAAVLAAQLTLEKIFIQAPFSGEVLEINYRQGDLVDMQTAAIMIANTKRLHVTVSVDENDIANVRVSQPATASFDALPGVTLPGVVSQVGRMGQNVQGIVRYDVEVTLLETHPSLLLGMTADIEIVTDIAEGTLAVPLDAIQLDDDGEFVMIYDEDTGEQNRVPVITGLIQGDYVIIREGDLQAGQRIVMFAAVPASSGSPFGGS